MMIYPWYQFRHSSWESDDELVTGFETSHASECVSLNCLLFQQ